MGLLWLTVDPRLVLRLPQSTNPRLSVAVGVVAGCLWSEVLNCVDLCRSLWKACGVIAQAHVAAVPATPHTTSGIGMA